MATEIPVGQAKTLVKSEWRTLEAFLTCAYGSDYMLTLYSNQIDTYDDGSVKVYPRNDTPIQIRASEVATIPDIEFNGETYTGVEAMGLLSAAFDRIRELKIHVLQPPAPEPVQEPQT